ncbi:hypothetical protein M2280_004790 [Prescottella agglutinans]|uniref:Uncharacterized protein n=1 Tax=Prescottella agglutinans TaxID=1644129 RepID=A0ABT6MGT7_9NOCA|nr:hypothetical protein [Prescottella agglutinans]
MFTHHATRARRPRHLSVVPDIQTEVVDPRGIHAWAATIVHLNNQGLPARVPADVLRQMWAAGLGRYAAKATVIGEAFA